MALSATVQAGELTRLFTDTANFPTTAQQAGQRWAAAYRTYAQSATAGTTVPLAPALQAAETLLASALAGAFTAAQQGGGDPVTALATAMSGAYVAFWFAPPMAFALPPITGVVTTAVPGQLPDALRTVFKGGLTGDATGQGQATALADALDAWTRTVQVTNTTPTGPVPPVALT